jgi:hypothetical protein
VIHRALAHYAQAWRSLRAWRAPLPTLVIVEPYRGGGRLGVARCGLRTATVYATGDLAEDLSTVLHELAHLAAPLAARSHGSEWRALFVAAAREVTGGEDDDLDDLNLTTTDLDAAIRDEIAEWLSRTSQTFAARLVHQRR